MLKISYSLLLMFKMPGDSIVYLDAVLKLISRYFNDSCRCVWTEFNNFKMGAKSLSKTSAYRSFKTFPTTCWLFNVWVVVIDKLFIKPHFQWWVRSLQLWIHHLLNVHVVGRVKTSSNLHEAKSRNLHGVKSGNLHEAKRSLRARAKDCCL